MNPENNPDLAAARSIIAKIRSGGGTIVLFTGGQTDAVVMSCTDEKLIREVALHRSDVKKCLREEKAVLWTIKSGSHYPASRREIAESN